MAMAMACSEMPENCPLPNNYLHATVRTNFQPAECKTSTGADATCLRHYKREKVKVNVYFEQVATVIYQEVADYEVPLLLEQLYLQVLSRVDKMGRVRNYWFVDVEALGG